MIDDKKIEDVAKQHSEESYISGYFQACYEDAFMDGAKWAINEFIKDLWHPANEVPEIGRVIIMENYYTDGRIIFISRIRKSTFHNPIDIGNTKKWFYIEDLFSKEGDKHD